MTVSHTTHAQSVQSTTSVCPAHQHGRPHTLPSVVPSASRLPSLVHGPRPGLQLLSSSLQKHHRHRCRFGERHPQGLPAPRCCPAAGHSRGWGWPSPVRRGRHMDGRRRPYYQVRESILKCESEKPGWRGRGEAFLLGRALNLEPLNGRVGFSLRGCATAGGPGGLGARREPPPLPLVPRFNAALPPGRAALGAPRAGPHKQVHAGPWSRVCLQSTAASPTRWTLP